MEKMYIIDKAGNVGRITCDVWHGAADYTSGYWDDLAEYCLQVDSGYEYLGRLHDWADEQGLDSLLGYDDDAAYGVADVVTEVLYIQQGDFAAEQAENLGEDAAKFEAEFVRLTPAAVLVCAKEQVRPGAKASAWDRGVSAYATGLVDSLAEQLADGSIGGGDLADKERLRKAMLNGAGDWEQYSAGGCALVYNEDIAVRLCTPSELRRKRGGMLPPSNWETWIDVQARALSQAADAVERCVGQAAKYL